MSDTPMTREQAWETVRNTLNDYVPAGDDYLESDAALAFLRTEMERLEGRIVDEAHTRQAEYAKRIEAEATVERLEGELAGQMHDGKAGRYWSDRDAQHRARIAELEATVERLEGERDDYKLAAGAEAQLVDEGKARIAELQAALREIANSKGLKPEMDASECRAIARAALPDTEGDHDLEVARQFQPLVAKAFEAIADTEGEQDG